MDTNESLANTHSVIGNSIYMKSGNDIRSLKNPLFMRIASKNA